MELNILHKLANVGVGLTKRGVEGRRKFGRVCIGSFPETLGLILEARERLTWVGTYA